MASPTLITPNSATPKPTTPPLIRSRIIASASPSASSAAASTASRRNFLSLSAGAALLLPPLARAASSEEEYVKETAEVIDKVRNTITLDKTDPSVAAAVAELRETSNAWVAKYRREKTLLGRASFRDMYSALNAVSGHYISFGPTAPIPAKRKQRILAEMDTAEKALPALNGGRGPPEAKLGDRNPHLRPPELLVLFLPVGDDKTPARGCRSCCCFFRPTTLKPPPVASEAFLWPPSQRSSNPNYLLV
ncbi:photosystem II family protein [Striga asiatica]|uniref:Photosystem II family protein n=1 Tax=Striga asiatica TaxID=4170 RepID=A0A5A7QEB9_STRAF|nr:photosystem II family protein [Striga asiatica]